MLLIRAILDRSLACLFANVVDVSRHGRLRTAVVRILWALRSASHSVVRELAVVRVLAERDMATGASSVAMGLRSLLSSMSCGVVVEVTSVSLGCASLRRTYAASVGGEGGRRGGDGGTGGGEGGDSSGGGEGNVAGVKAHALPSKHDMCA